MKRQAKDVVLECYRLGPVPHSKMNEWRSLHPEDLGLDEGALTKKIRMHYIEDLTGTNQQPKGDFVYGGSVSCEPDSA